MTEHLDDCSGDVGRPHGDHSIGMPQLHDAVPGILPHRITRAHPRPVLRYYLPRAGVLSVEQPFVSPLASFLELALSLDFNISPRQHFLLLSPDT